MSGTERALGDRISPGEFCVVGDSHRSARIQRRRIASQPPIRLHECNAYLPFARLHPLFALLSFLFVSHVVIRVEEDFQEEG